MKASQLVVALVAGAALLSLGFYFGGAFNPPLGASAGTDHYNEETFHNNVYGRKVFMGGTVSALGSVTSTTLTARQVCANNSFTADANTTDTPIVLPHATSTNAQCLKTDGDYTSFLFQNTSATWTAALIGTSTGVDLIAPGANDDIVNGGNDAWVTIYRDSSSTNQVIVEELTAAD